MNRLTPFYRATRLPRSLASLLAGLAMMTTVTTVATVITVTTIATLSSVACAQSTQLPPQTGLPQGKVEAKGVVFTVDLAQTRQQQAHGLSGRAHLGSTDGMLFPYAEKDTYGFWMRAMVISIDIIWLDNREVVHIEHNVPAPAPGTPDHALPSYTPRKPANFVLEIAAGRAQEIGLRVGDLVRYHLNR